MDRSDESLLRLMVKEKGQAAAERQRLTFLFPFVHHQPRDESAAVPIGRPWDIDRFFVLVCRW